MQIALTIIGWIVPPLLTLLIGWLAAKNAEQKRHKSNEEKRNETIRKSIKYIMRRNLQSDYEYYCRQQGYCTIEDKKDIQDEYELYHDGLGGNGAGTRYYDAIMALPETEEDRVIHNH